MRFISGLFDFDQLLPAALMSGLRIEIQLAQYKHVVQSSNATQVAVEGDEMFRSCTMRITNLRIVADSVKLTDSISRVLNERAANNGLEIPFRTWHTSHFISPTEKSDYNIEVRKAVSRAFGALAFVRPVYAEDDEKSPIFDPNETISFLFKEWQYRAGNLYFPHQRMRRRESINYINPTVDIDITELSNPIHCGALETYYHFQRMFGKNKTHFNENDFPIEFYRTADSGGIAVPDPWLDETNSNEIRSCRNYCILPVDLERSTTTDLSGIPMNNSRVLALDFTTCTAVQAHVSIHMQYLKVARVFMDNTEVEE